MKLKFVDWKKMYDPEKVISSSEYYDNKKQFTPNGLFSETIFGKNSDPEGADKIGWINMGDIQIISPIFFERLKKVLKGSVLNRIINYNKKTDEFGDLVDEKMKGKDIEYQNIGIPGFIKNFEDIINLYGNTECNEYPVVMNAYHNDILFTNILPVFSSKLRPGILYGGNSKDKDRKAVFKYDDINNYYNIIIQYSNKIKDMDEDPNDNDYKLVVYPMITELQNYANNILKFIINNFLKGKKGMFRKEIAATRVNFSSRNVLTPLQDAEMDKISLPYLTFLELYRFLLINLMVKNEGISYVEADQYIQNCKTHFDKKLYKYMLMLVEHGKLRILLNRNPSINIGSILVLEVGNVKDNFDDLTLSVPNMILTNLNADYDGDVLNIIALLTDSFKKYFENLMPQNLIISKNNGKFDRGYSLSKDSRAGFQILNN